ncbi:MAG: ABC transporter substrate-binding protein [Pseudomonadota bacterium]
MRDWLRSGIHCVLLAAALFCGQISYATAAGVLRVGVQLEPPNLDPTSGAAAAIDEIVYANIFEGLTRINEDGSVAPALAMRWSVSEDGMAYVFHLQRDVRFHDGAPFSAADVKFSLERAGAETSTNAQRAIFSSIVSVDVIDVHTVRIRLSEPLGALPTYLGWGDAVIVSPASAATNATNPIGTGPFVFDRWRQGASVRLSANAEYWGTPAKLDGIEFVFIPDPTAAFAALFAGDVDGFPNYPAPENLPLIERDERFNVLSGASEGEMILAINNDRPPFNDLRIRKALSHAIDKRAVIKGALYGYGEPIGSHFPPHHSAYVDLSNRYPFNPEKARRLIAEAGYPDGFEAQLTLPPPAYARRSGEIIAAQLSAVGVKVRIRNIEWAQWLEQIFANKAYDLTIVSHTEPLDIDIYARDDYYFQYRDEKFKNIIVELKSAVEPDARHKLLVRAQEKLAEDAVNVFLASSPKIGVWDNGVIGVWRHGPVQANDFTQTQLSGGATRSQASDRIGALPIFPILIVLAILALVSAAYFARASLTYLLKRFIVMGITLFAASLIIFTILEVAPGDPAIVMMGVNADEQSLEAVREEFGLDAPAPVRYLNWIIDFARGDFGQSFTYRTPVAELVSERLWVSLPLAFLAFILAAITGITAGAAAAIKEGGPIDAVIRAGSQAGIAAPNFWLSILFVLIFAVGLRWFSAGGFPGWENGFGPALKSLLLPAIALAIPQAAILAQLMRTSMFEIMEKDFVRTAQAKGLTRNAAIRRHGVRNAIIPILTILGLQFSFLIAGAVIVENVFYLPGVGRLVFQSIVQRDLIVVKAIVAMLVLTVVFMAFLIDLSYAIADPRLRRKTQS